ncbi:MAG: hypothetical protein IJF48_05495, partial [Clostridia bacterium]|nr:hypothetical protein [Clostridia bacterium]
MANKTFLFLIIITLILGCCACSFSTNDIDIPTDTVKDITESPYSEDSNTVDIEGTSADSYDTSEPETEPVSPPDNDVSEFEILTDPATPSREDVERLLSHAADIWNQLHISSLDAIYDESLKVVDGFYTYLPVREYETKDEFRARLRESFSEMLTEYMLGYLFDCQYKEFDGRLYVSPGDRGTDMRAGAQTMKYEVIDDTTVRVIRCVDVEEIAEMYDGEKYSYIIYLQGVCEQELMLIYEQGRWVFDTFTVFDAIDGYDDGEGIKYDYATDIAYAFLGAEISAARPDGEEYDYLNRRIVGYRENSDEAVTVTVRVSTRR